MCLYLQKVKELVADEVVDKHPCLLYINYADKEDYLINIRSVIANYKPYFVGVARKQLDQKQLRAMETILNAIGLWSERWAHHLTEAQILQEPYQPPVRATVAQ